MGKNDVHMQRIYLDDYVLQKDMRIRIPKEIVRNLNVKPGESFFEIYSDPSSREIVLVSKDSKRNEH